MTKTLTAERAAQTTATRLSLAQLTETARAWAPRVGNGAATGQPSDKRWYCRLERNDVYEVWLMGWDNEQSTDFHDHGGSAGAVAVVAGALVERRAAQFEDEVRASKRLAEAGTVFAFGGDVVHDVTNADLGPSLSIHVYSPPLSSMTYYDVDTEIEARETAMVTGPEPDAIDLTGKL